MAKFADGGRSQLLEGKDTLQLVLEHVGYDIETPAQYLADHSPLISFSVSPNRAFAFCERNEKRRLRLKPCFLDQATHFLWELDLELPHMIRPGLCEIVYRADPVNCLAFLEEQLQRGYQEEAATGDPSCLLKSLSSVICSNHAANDTRDHYAILIDVLGFMGEHDLSLRDKRLVVNTRERATRDQEWLLHPADPMPDGHGVSARFWMNRDLRVHGCFRELV